MVEMEIPYTIVETYTSTVRIEISEKEYEEWLNGSPIPIDEKTALDLFHKENPVRDFQDEIVSVELEDIFLA